MSTTTSDQESPGAVPWPTVTPGPTVTASTTVTAVTADDVLATVVELVVELLGDYVDADLRIGRDTTFHDDLELESVDLVTLADLLAQRFGPQVNLSAYFADKGLADVIAMTVGEVADYVTRQCGGRTVTGRG